MTCFTYDDGKLTISFEVGYEPSNEEIVAGAMFVLERCMGEEIAQTHLRKYLGID
jgi:hypothetical protein